MSEFEVPSAISLTLEDDTAPSAPDAAGLTNADLLVHKQIEKDLPKPLDIKNLSPTEQKMVEDFSKQINIHNTNQILQYGAGAQRKVSTFSETALQKVRTQDMGEVGTMLSSLVVQLRGFSIEEERPRFFKKVANRLETMRAGYANAEKNVDNITTMLQNHQIRLMKDVAVFDQMYEMNLNYYKELTMYILAGKQSLNKALNEELPALQKRAQESGLPEDAQAANDFGEKCNRFEKKLHDLELTRIVSIQMAPQIRLVQNNDTLMVEKIQSSISNTIPLWKNQMVLAMGLENSQKAIEAQRAVTDMTNQLLRRNADMLKIGTIEAAKESERSIVDIETLKHTNEQLISTMDEVLRIQAEGRQKRRDAEVEMARIENQLKNKLLEIRSN